MLKDKVIYTLSTIKMHLRGGKIDTVGDWVVMGVIIGKGHPKISKKGSQFSVLSLSDLTGDCTRVVSVMLFGRAHEKLFKLNLGTVIGLLNPSILENRDGRFGVDATLSVSTPDRVLEIGQSKDYGLCQGRKKDGTACVVPVNKATCQFCVHHLQGEYRKAAAKRQSLNTGLNSVDPKRRFSDKMCLGGNVVCLESSEGLADAKRRKLSMSGLAKNNTAQSLGSVDKLKHLSDAEKTAVTKFRKSDPELGNLLAVPGPGARMLLSQLTQTSQSVQQSGSAKPKMTVVNPKELLKRNTTSSSRASVDAQRLASLGGSVPSVNASVPLTKSEGSLRQITAISSSKLGGVPRREPAANSIQPKTTSDEYYVDFDDDDAPSSQKVSMSAAKVRAMRKLKGEKISKVDPNEMLKRNASKDASQKTNRIAARLAALETESGNENASPVEISKPKRRGAFAEALGISLTEEEQKKLGDVTAKSQDLLKGAVLLEEDAYFNRLAFKDTLEEKMAQVKEMECTMVICAKCKYRALGQSDMCKLLMHDVKRIKGKKRWFECKNCKNRVISLDRMPKKACDRCETDVNEWKKVYLIFALSVMEESFAAEDDATSGGNVKKRDGAKLRKDVDKRIVCFDLSAGDDFPGDALNSTEQPYVVIIAIIGKAGPEADWAKGVPVEELLSCKPSLPRSWTGQANDDPSILHKVRGVYDPVKKLVILSLESPVIDADAILRLNPEIREEFLKTGFLPTWTQINADFHQALFFIFSVSHIVIVSHRNAVFDASWLRVFLALNPLREDSRKKVTSFLRAFESEIDDEWIDHGRLCTPRVLFYFPADPSIVASVPQTEDRRCWSSWAKRTHSGYHAGLQMSPAVRKKVSKLVESLEDSIYKILRKARVITNSAAHALFALPSSERFVFLDVQKRNITRGTMHSSLGLLRSLVASCEAAPKTFQLSTTDANSGESSVNSREDDHSVNHNAGGVKFSASFAEFVGGHVELAAADGFDDSVGRRTAPASFVLPKVGEWARVAPRLYEFLTDRSEEMAAAAVRAVNVEMRYSEMRCEKVLPVAIAAYQENLPPHYNEALHLTRLRHAENVMIGQRTGPLCGKYMQELRKECDRIWKSGRQMCSEQEWLPVMPHCSGLKYVSTCDCGRRQSSREDPFEIQEANVAFYSRMGGECCRLRCNYFPLPANRSSSLKVSTEQKSEVGPEEKRLRYFGEQSVKEADNGNDVRGKTEGEPGDSGEQLEGSKRPFKDEDQSGRTGLSMDFARASLSQHSNESATALEILSSNGKFREPSPSSGTPQRRKPLSYLSPKPQQETAEQQPVEEEDEEEDEEEEESDAEENDEYSGAEEETTEEMLRRLKCGDDAEGEEELKGRRTRSPSPTGPRVLAVDADAPHWALVCVGSASIYSHSAGIHDQPNFSSWSNYLLPWIVKVKFPDKGPRNLDNPNKPPPAWNTKKRDINDGDAKLKIFIGLEYECHKGHRFMAAGPNRILRAVPNPGEKIGRVKEFGKDIMDVDMPLYMNCSCRSEPAAVAQLMRLHVVTPKAPARVAGIHDQPNFSSWSNYLLPWIVKVKFPDKGPRNLDNPNKPPPAWNTKKRDINDGDAKLKIFIGLEYECHKGHRFMAAGPNRILRAVPNPGEKIGRVKEFGKDIMDVDMPLYMNCSCSGLSHVDPVDVLFKFSNFSLSCDCVFQCDVDFVSNGLKDGRKFIRALEGRVEKNGSEPAAVAQLMRLHVVTPKAPARVLLDPRVRPSPEAPVFTPKGGAGTAGDGPTTLSPMALTPSKYWILRFPFCYVADSGADSVGIRFPPPKEINAGNMPRLGVLLRGSLSVDGS
ncbi:unnamed protein product [Notodromas monacha]|uniref:Nonsense-mediated mRNA decay factor SMG8 n=1 Tax=Notodromas monacha TaxID=399045 RepID=A0A7R9BXT6_9CRUS|nr:unnamed protein product [Notodromas monacha]CAG0922634.1 unnamed protein product [Notodromas monacha]